MVRGKAVPHLAGCDDTAYAQIHKHTHTIRIVVICSNLALGIQMHLRLPCVRIREESVGQRLACHQCTHHTRSSSSRKMPDEAGCTTSCLAIVFSPCTIAIIPHCQAARNTTTVRFANSSTGTGSHHTFQLLLNARVCDDMGRIRIGHHLRVATQPVTYSHLLVHRQLRPVCLALPSYLPPFLPIASIIIGVRLCVLVADLIIPPVIIRSGSK